MTFALNWICLHLFLWLQRETFCVFNLGKYWQLNTVQKTQRKQSFKSRLFDLKQVFSCPYIKNNNSLHAAAENSEVLLLCQHWMHSSQEQTLIIEKK